MMQNREIVLASANAGKLREFQELLAGMNLQVHSQGEFQVSAAEETGLSFVENALIKARHAATHTSRPALADDSGLVVDALEGRPGIYSARYAGTGASDADNLEKVLAEISNFEPETLSARFVCVIAVVRHALDPMPMLAEGVWEGRLTTEASGSGGFGYDPIFYLPELGMTSAQLPAEKKNLLSHRGKATRQILEQLRREYPD